MAVRVNKYVLELQQEHLDQNRIECNTTTLADFVAPCHAKPPPPLVRRRINARATVGSCICCCPHLPVVVKKRPLLFCERICCLDGRQISVHRVHTRILSALPNDNVACTAAPCRFIMYFVQLRSSSEHWQAR